MSTLQYRKCTRHARKEPKPWELTIGTWNVHGLTAASKRETLGSDCEHYNIDILCIQETKTKEHWEQHLQSKHKLILLQQKDSYHRGLGFVISPRLMNNVVSFRNISDRVATLDITIPTKSGEPKKCRIINAYGPTSEKAIEDSTLLDNFYEELEAALRLPARWMVYICGDFNAKLGKYQPDNDEAGYRSCMGAYGCGTRNSNGFALLSFLSTHGLFACNTAFKHPAKHRTSWTCHIKDHKSSIPNATRAIFNQIDYVLCQKESVALLRNSRSFGGTDLNSDHKLILTSLRIDKMHLTHKQKSSSVKVQRKINIERLNNDKNIQEAYQRKIEDGVSNENLDNPNDALNNILNHMKNSAFETAGKQKKRGESALWTDDPTITELSEKQKALRLRIYQHGGGEDRTGLRKDRNRILREISKLLKAHAIKRAEALAEKVSSADNCQQMFQAAKQLKTMKPASVLTVHDEEGNFIATDKGKAAAIRAWFKEQFTDSECAQLQQFEGDPRPLHRPITEEEVKIAIGSLKNGKAAGPDTINNELFKQSPPIISKTIAKIINSSLEQHIFLNNMAEGTMIALPKPGKTPGPPCNLRPIVLLNGIRKILSTITLHRIRNKIDQFTGPVQAGFKRGRSCADIVWAQRMLVSVVLTRKWDFHKMGIDMSKAFDTIKRGRILEVLMEAGCGEDDLRLVRMLLADTVLQVRVKSETSAEFITNIGSPQGDSLSPVLFTCYLSAALKTIREHSNRPNPLISALGMPLEMEYADDVDFIDEEKIPLKQLQEIAAKQLKEQNLFMNQTKTEFTHVFLAETGEMTDDDKPLRDNEPWRKNKTLGSLLCSTEDITSRCISGNIAFRSMWKLWSQKSRIPLKVRLRLYNSYCIPIMLYNCNSWAVTKATLNKLDACHRKHLRSITGHRWPHSLISNKALYRVCNEEPLSSKALRQRWTMFGHVLRMPTDSPAQQALDFALVGSSAYQGRRGRHCSNLLETLRSDLKSRGKGPFTTKKHLIDIRNTARDRVAWKSLKD